MLRPCAIGCTIVGLLVLSVSTALAADWPCWRGPNHDNRSEESGWRTDWKANPPKVLWQAATGWRWGCPVVAGGRVFVHGDDYSGRSGTQILHALDADTGKELWRDESFVWGYNIQPLTYSPAVDGDHVYFYTASGVLKCLQAATGETVWTQDLSKTLRARREVSYGYRCSPVVW
ncbi:MAG TPA: PQQ-binding-like beta-propeller repeat protein, partial [Planctomycetota bacterium]|nr:PQQ-binding-like beta-propeller repeat protein [Planctomycetota bacterium]